MSENTRPEHRTPGAAAGHSVLPSPRRFTRSALAACALAPALVVASPTPPPPAPAQQLGSVTVVGESRGSRTIVDSAGHTHVVMKKVTAADRKAAAVRARATRQAAARQASVATEKSEVSK